MVSQVDAQLPFASTVLFKQSYCCRMILWFFLAIHNWNRRMNCGIRFGKWKGPCKRSKTTAGVKLKVSTGIFGIGLDRVTPLNLTEYFSSATASEYFPTAWHKTHPNHNMFRIQSHYKIVKSSRVLLIPFVTKRALTMTCLATEWIKDFGEKPF